MSFTKKIFAVAAFCGVFGMTMLPLVSVQADTTPTSSASTTPPSVTTAPSTSSTGSCQLQDALNALEAAEANNSEYTPAGVKAILNAKQTLLSQTIDCLVAEVAATKDDLTGVQFTDPTLQQIQGQISAKLDTITQYYQDTQSSLNGLGLRGIQDAADQVRSERDNVYAPLAQQVLNLVFWSKNEDLLTTAQARLQSIQTSITNLNLSDNTEITNLLSQAQSDLTAAQNAQAQAQEILEKNTGDDPIPSINTALTNLSDAYQDFLNISQNVSGLLSH